MKDIYINQLDRSQRVRLLASNLVPPFAEDSRGAQLLATVIAIKVESASGV